jgi:hypothetical protein
MSRNPCMVVTGLVVLSMSVLANSCGCEPGTGACTMTQAARLAPWLAGHVHDSVPARHPMPLRLRGGSWLFTPKIVPVSDGDGGVVQWRQQPVPAKMAIGTEGLLWNGEGRSRQLETGQLAGTKAAAGGVQQTNDESTASKASAARAGYFSDAYVERFVAHVPTRTALINRGYFARVLAVRSMISAFLDACNARGQPCQILSLGSGFDTAFWVMKRQQKLDRCVWVEVDFPETVSGFWTCSSSACLCP